MTCLKAVAGGVEITVKVVPGASRDRIAGVLGDALKIQVAAPPERGKANAAVVELLAARLGLAGRDLAVIRGQTAPRKTILIRGTTVEAVATALAAQ